MAAFTAGSAYVVVSITWHQWHHTACRSSSTNLCSVAARVNAESLQVVSHWMAAVGLDSRGALPATGWDSAEPLPATGLHSAEPLPAASATDRRSHRATRES